MSCMNKYIADADFSDTGFSYTMSLISGKHKMVILYCLMEFEPVRFNELKRYLKSISDKTLSTNLKELEADRLIVRTEYPQHPAEGGVPSQPAGKVADGGAGPALSLGRGESSDGLRGTRTGCTKKTEGRHRR